MPLISTYLTGCYKKNYQRGFTLIELIVTIGILIVLTTVLLANYNTFSSTIVLANQAHLLAQSVREAQIYAMSTRGVGGSFTHGVGVAFNEDNVNQYVLYNDINDNQIYDSGEELAVRKFQTGVSFRPVKGPDHPFCGYLTTGPASCADKKYFYVFFIRPNPDAIISGCNGAGCNSDKVASRLEVILQNKKGTQRKVIVWITGQISVQ